MSTGFRISGGGNNTLLWNLSIGDDVGFSLEDTSNNIMQGNIAIGKEVLEVFGQEFADVAIAVQKSKDIEALAALASVVREPKTDSLGWSILIKKFGLKIGRFDTSAFLSGFLSAAAWESLKLILKKHGINI